jgi:hypothetical protein
MSFTFEEKVKCLHYSTVKHLFTIFFNGLTAREYSIEFGFPPWNHYHDTSDIEDAISVAKELTLRSNVTTYVVDTKPITMYEEIFVCISSDFKYTRRK